MNCPDCGSDLCSHGVCVNYCHDEGCWQCLEEAGAHNYIVANVNAANRIWNLVGGFPEEEEEGQVFNDPPEITEHEKREEN